MGFQSIDLYVFCTASHNLNYFGFYPLKGFEPLKKQ